MKRYAIFSGLCAARGFGLVLTLAFGASMAFGQTTNDVQKLSLNQPIERQIKGGETQEFQFKLKKGEFAHAEVEQKDIDVVVSLIEPDGNVIIEMAGNSNYLWREPVSVIAKSDGIFKLQIKSVGLSKTAGRYTARLAELREPNESDRQRIEAEQLLIQAIKLGNEDQSAERIKAFEKSLNLWRQVGDRHWESIAMFNLAYIYYFADRDAEALNLFNNILLSFQELNDRIGEAATLRGLGVINRYAKNYAIAKQCLEKSLIIQKELKDFRGEFDSLNLLLLAYVNLQQNVDVIKSLERMLEISREQKNAPLEIDVLKKFGDFYQSKKNSLKAIAFYEQALKNHYKLALNNQNQIDEYNLLLKLNSVYKELNKSENVLKNLDRMILIAEGLKNEQLKADVLYEFGLFYYSQGLNIKDQIKRKNTFQNAIANFKIAYSIYEKLNPLESFLGRIGCVRYIGSTYSEIKDNKEAIPYFKIALNILDEWEKSCSSCNLKVLKTFLYEDIGFSYFIENNEEEAIKFLKQVDYENPDDWKDNKLLLKRTTDLLLDLYNSHIDLDDYEKTINDLNKILTKSSDYGYDDVDRMGFAITLGGAYLGAGYYAKAIETDRESLRISQKIQKTSNEFINYKKKKLLVYAKETEATAYNNIGIGYLRAGNLLEAEKYVLKSLEILKKTHNAVNIVKYQANLGAIYSRKGSYESSIKIFEETIPKLKKLREKFVLDFSLTKDISSRLEERNLTNFVIITTYYYGKSLRQIGKYKEAVNAHNESIEIAKNSNLKKYEARARIELALDYLAINNSDLALHEFDTAYKLSKSTNARDEETAALDGLMKAWKLQENQTLAVIFGKKAVNLLQKTRIELLNLGKNVAAEFTKDNEDTYRNLADLLISQGRFPEAQQTLDFLKEEEYSQITRANPKDDTVPYSKTESSVLAKIDSLAVLENEQSELKKQQKEQGSQFPADKMNRLKQIDADIKIANREFENALKILAESLADTDVIKQIDTIKGEQNLQSALSKLGDRNSGVVALYTLIGTEEVKDEIGNPIKGKKRSKFGWVILVTPNDRKAYPIDITNLEDNVFQFQKALRTDEYDPKPLAEKIYNAIFRQTSVQQKTTLEADLQQILGKYENKTIMWSLDGVLRYIPMAALHDGNDYLIEKYRNVVFNSQSILWLMNPPESNQQTLGLGVSSGNKELGMSELPGVEKELVDIIKQTNESTGILTGTRKLNNQFKKQDILNLKDVDNEFHTVHIASHYSFNPTDQDSSFLLIGDGKLTFKDMRDEPNLFGTVDLLTLSACETGISGNGKEAEGFSILSQNLGAKSVIASLWKVSDAGTPKLMTRFYQLRKDNPQMSKGEAFRRAQLSLLKGKVESEDKSSANRTGVVAVSGKKSELPLFVKDEKKPFAHPHYWASFVLIGNWR